MSVEIMIVFDIVAKDIRSLIIVIIIFLIRVIIILKIVLLKARARYRL